MIELEPHSQGVILPVRAQAGARTAGVRGESAGALKVCVTAAPEKGKANKALLAVLSKALGLKKSQLQLVAGQTSAQKRFLVRELDVEQLRQRIVAALAARHPTA